MNKELLFEGIGRKKDKISTVKEALNTLDGYSFPDAVENWLNGIGFGGDGGGVDFPEDGDKFEGVRCYYLGGIEEKEVIVSEDEFFTVLKEACQRYIELCPEKREELQQIMSQSTLL
jgi:hypothetical protein